MSYLKLSYAAVILPIILVLYNLIPKNSIRRWFLLLVNAVFYFILGTKRILFLILSIISVYFSARLLDKIDNKKEELLKEKNADKSIINKKIKREKKLVLLFCILFNVLFLIIFKYLNFFALNVNGLLDLLNINYEFKALKILAPIGISFYTLSALTYIIDVYNGKIKSDKSFVKVALFLSFFPQIMEGPIVRFSETAEELYAAKKTDYNNIIIGYQRILYGLFKKLLIADRLNPIVKNIFNNYSSYSGFTIFMGAVMYTVMLYMEFSGTMDSVVGTGRLFGVKVPENFRQPFFSKNVSEFWTRWHISLGAWFKDYIYYPISLSRPLRKLTIKMRKKLGNHYGPLISGTIALFVVWFLNGLWHGAGYTFLFFGLYHFVMIAGGNFINPVIIWLCKILHINRENIVYRVLQSVKMCFFVVIGEMFFNSKSMTDGIGMFKGIFTRLSINTKELLSLGIDIYDYIIVFAAIVFVFIVSLIKEKNKADIIDLSKKKTWVRWSLLYLVIAIMLVFGAYGPGYEQLDPIYADF